ncbi:hypothetical protein B0H19DRAFT_1074720 [Mycena capillaripes]|nr:hypothetical protein B0H19DRAFT_1074720 [Mycena capillaripes]
MAADYLVQGRKASHHPPHARKREQDGGKIDGTMARRQGVAGIFRDELARSEEGKADTKSGHTSCCRQQRYNSGKEGCTRRGALPRVCSVRHLRELELQQPGLYPHLPCIDDRVSRHKCLDFENSRSTDTLVPGMARKSRAMAAIIGKSCSFFCNGTTNYWLNDSGGAKHDVGKIGVVVDERGGEQAAGGGVGSV